jgi:hypothetical protein
MCGQINVIVNIVVCTYLTKMLRRAPHPESVLVALRYLSKSPHLKEPALDRNPSTITNGIGGLTVYWMEGFEEAIRAIRRLKSIMA